MICACSSTSPAMRSGPWSGSPPVTMNPWLDATAEARRSAGLRRSLSPRQPGETLLDLAGNDYLGLSHDPDVIAAAIDAARVWGTGSTGSRLVSGSTELHHELEDALSNFVGHERALVFSSGYLANLGAVAALTGADALIVSDQLVHASLVDACRLSRARVVVTPHRDSDAVDRALEKRSEERAIVLTDAVFSVDGDLAPVAELVELTSRHGAVLLVDEAHSLGTVGEGGRGVLAAADLAGRDHVVSTVTLSKSLGAQGGAVIGSARVIDHLIDAARPFIFDTGLAPTSVGAAFAALRILCRRPQLAADVRARARDLYAIAIGLGLDASEPAAAVVSIRVGDPLLAVEAAKMCARHGVRVGCFRPPSTPDPIARLRLTARADLSAEDLDLASTALAATSASILTGTPASP